MSGTARLITIHNERVKLRATILNNAALAFIGAGFIVPTVAGQLRDGWHALVTAVWIGCGVGLHYAARYVLGSLR
jgi:hypothetical protein